MASWVPCPCGYDWRGCRLCNGTGELDLPLPLPPRLREFEMAMFAGLIADVDDYEEAA